MEIGTVTPKPQMGNDKPRLFRIKEANGIINRMGFNNHGVDVMIDNIEQAKYQGVLGINIGKKMPRRLLKMHLMIIFIVLSVFIHMPAISRLIFQAPIPKNCVIYKVAMPYHNYLMA